MNAVVQDPLMSLTSVRAIEGFVLRPFCRTVKHVMAKATGDASISSRPGTGVSTTWITRRTLPGGLFRAVHVRPPIMELRPLAVDPGCCAPLGAVKRSFESHVPVDTQPGNGREEAVDSERQPRGHFYRSGGAEDVCFSTNEPSINARKTSQQAGESNTRVFKASASLQKTLPRFSGK